MASVLRPALQPGRGWPRQLKEEGWEGSRHPGNPKWANWELLQSLERRLDGPSKTRRWRLAEIHQEWEWKFTFWNTEGSPAILGAIGAQARDRCTSKPPSPRQGEPWGPEVWGLRMAACALRVATTVR